jgi:hypothetical protein
VTGGKIAQVSEQVELVLRWEGTAARWWTAGTLLFAVVAGCAAGWGVEPVLDWAVLAVLAGGAALGCAAGLLRRRLEAGPDGLRFRMVVRWRRLGWGEIVRFEDLRVSSAHARVRTPAMRVAALLRDGSLVMLPVPLTGAADAHVFEKQLSRLRALHARHRSGALGA